MTGRSLASPRVRAAVVLAVVVAGLGVLAWTGMDESLVYYRTPTEVSEDPPDTEQRVRMGGLVVPGSVSRSNADGSVTLRISDGTTEVTVRHTGDLPQIFDEGQGAVVEGFVDDTGELRSDSLMVRHSNEYRPPEDVDVEDSGP